jgi:hypothetical protein
MKTVANIANPRGNLEEIIYDRASNKADETFLNSQVNPEFAELLMLWPAKWTDFTPLEMDKFRLWLNWHGKPCA